MQTVQRDYFNTILSPAYSQIRLNYVGCATEPLSSRHGPAIHHMYTIFYVISGRGYYEVADERYTVNAGEIFVTRPDDVSLYYSDPDTPWTYCWICFSGDDTTSLMQDGGLLDDYVFKQSDDGFYRAVLDCLNYVEDNASVSQVMLNSHVMRCVAAAEIAAKDPVKPLVSKTVQNYVDLGTSYIQYHYAQHITISSVAEYVGLERSYFYRIFKQELGISPEEYLIQCRITHAKELIRKGVAFREVAQSVGIGDVYYFSKVFKKQEGITPGEYRKMIS